MNKTLSDKCERVLQIVKVENEAFFVKESNYNEVPYDYILSKLDSDSERILYCDFIVVQPKLWYKNFYSKSTYYRLKHIALDKFLAYYENATFLEEIN